MLQYNRCLLKCTFGRSVLLILDLSRETLKMIFGKERVEDDIFGVAQELLKNPKGYRQKVLKYYENEKAENPEICKECGGKCCISAPCHWSPQDIEDLSYDGLKKLLEDKKYISILQMPSEVCECCLREVFATGDYYYVLRTRTRGTGIAVIKAEIHRDDPCMLLKPDGCQISFQERPRGARLLIPMKNYKCKSLYDFDDCVYDWEDYQEVLSELFQYFREKEQRQIAAEKNDVHL